MNLKTLFALLCTLSCAHAGGAGWSHQFDAAKQQAAAERKDLLVDFTGSDWCSWCIKLNKEVFDHDAFRNGVKDSFVLVELDYPQDDSKLSAETKKQNETLLKTYPVKGYPTILLCDAEGKPFAATGYQAGGPDKYVAHLAELRAQRTARDAAFAKAAQASGVDQAKLYIAALEAMKLDDAMLFPSYQEIADLIRAADPGDETGFAKKSGGKQRLAAFLEKFGELSKKGDQEGALGFIAGTLAEKDLPADVNQHVHGHKAALMLHAKKPQEALKVLEEGIAVAPESEVAAELKKFLGFVQKQIESAPPQDTPAAK